MPKAAFAEDQISSSYMHNYNYKIKSEILCTSSYLIFTAGFLAFLNVLVFVNEAGIVLVYLLEPWLSDFILYDRTDCKMY